MGKNVSLSELMGLICIKFHQRNPFVSRKYTIGIVDFGTKRSLFVFYVVYFIKTVESKSLNDISFQNILS